MTREEWEAILKPLSFALSGAAMFAASQKLHRQAKGLPHCEPGEMDRLFLEKLTLIERRLSSVERAVLPMQGRLRSRLQRWLRLLFPNGSTGA